MHFQITMFKLYAFPNYHVKALCISKLSFMHLPCLKFQPCEGFMHFQITMFKRHCSNQIYDKGSSIERVELPGLGMVAYMQGSNLKGRVPFHFEGL